MNITIDEIKQIVRQVVIDSAYQEGLQLNSYTHVSAGNNPDIRQSNFNQAIDNYLQNDFWARSWVYAGASPDTLKGEFPAVFMELSNMTVPNIDEDNVVFPIDFVIYDTIECSSCSDPDRRTHQTVESNCKMMLRAFLRELFTYEKWEVDRDGDTTEEWVSIGRREYEDALLDIDYLDHLDSLCSMIDTEAVTIRSVANLPDITGAATTITFDVCQAITPSFNYETPTLINLSSVLCC